ncbi:MAG: 16S rRNA (uracil(1498)-N(3))-methyltransferase [Ignavibacteria bacterium]|nr:16S rRNA (uracil(1498)-N(3))-methyltransferase [Ignavibacteria bacterium]
MECLYQPNLTPETMSLTIRGEEFRHLWALRLRAGERILLTSGVGLCAIAVLTHISKLEATLRIEEVHPNYGEDTRRVGLAIGILESRERMEFALEKATELGITDFYPLACEFSQKKTISLERLQAKAVAAVKQCKRSHVPVIHPPLRVEELLENSKKWTTIILADMEGVELRGDTHEASTLVFIGTEGGFSPKELTALRADSRTVRLFLGERRLRAETAAIAALCRV